ncbi:MAG: class I SAM-dependent methyltransferase [Chitinophagales bacterium]|nr:class I SAM-dependent methyltransferase [Chitinophagales bacterium]
MFRSLYRFLHPRFQPLFLEYKTEFKPRYIPRQSPHPELLQLISRRQADYKALLEKAIKYKAALLTIQQQDNDKNSLQPAWDNKYLPGMDIIMLYTLLATIRPKRYFEIGSGHSTKVAAKAIREQQLNTSITCIDPQPRTEISSLAQRMIRQPLENTDTAIFSELEENDILFVDNTHRLLPNSDTMVFFLEILPRLKKGVYVQLHDVYLPYDYPEFMCERFYSEQYALAIALLANPAKYKIVLPNYYIHENEVLSQILSPLFDQLKNTERHGGSFWFRVEE